MGGNQPFVRANEMPEVGAGMHPARVTVGEHLPYTGREVQVFSRLGYHYPPGYLPNTPVGGFRGFFTTLTTPSFGVKPDYFMRIGVGAAKFAGCFLLFYLPLDNMYCSLRQKQRNRREKLRGSA